MCSLLSSLLALMCLLRLVTRSLLKSRRFSSSEMKVISEVVMHSYKCDVLIRVVFTSVFVFTRRESERRNHSLARHADILAAVETRLSLLNMTFMKYVDSNLCCFIPGKVSSGPVEVSH